jgi:predicted metal-dependent hydrolase
VEFNLFAKNELELEDKREVLRNAGFQLLTVKLLDAPPVLLGKQEALREGVAMFNEERFWEAHEILEQVWREEKSVEREAIQSLILTCAAFVHYQKGETEICLSVLRRAKAKMIPGVEVSLLDLQGLQSNVDTILSSGRVRLFKLREDVSYPFLKSTTSAATKIVSARPPASKTPGSG